MNFKKRFNAFVAVVLAVMMTATSVFAAPSMAGVAMGAGEVVEEAVEPEANDKTKDETKATVNAEGDVAQIGTTTYATFADAIAAAGAGDTVELIANCSLTSTDTGEDGLTLKNVNLTFADGVTLTLETGSKLVLDTVNLTNATIAGAGATSFSGDVNFYGTNSVTSDIGGTPFELIVNKGATLFITRFVLGYNRGITVYGDIEDAHSFDPTGKTPSLKFNSTSGVSVGGTGTGNITAKDAYIELGNSSWKNSMATHLEL